PSTPSPPAFPTPPGRSPSHWGPSSADPPMGDGAGAAHEALPALGAGAGLPSWWWFLWCLAKLELCEKIFPHWGHSARSELGLSPVWHLWWTVRSELDLKPFPHCPHSKGRSPVWILWWLIKGRSPVWILKWLIRRDFHLKLFSHSEHL
uniref:Uncharacterized protein n=1 Tax=Cyanoderma ruficeps TaxID=181631 RepID=A0A8C3QKX1_9PASS